MANREQDRSIMTKGRPIFWLLLGIVLYHYGTFMYGLIVSSAPPPNEEMYSLPASELPPGNFPIQGDALEENDIEELIRIRKTQEDAKIQVSEKAVGRLVDEINILRKTIRNIEESDIGPQIARDIDSVRAYQAIVDEISKLDFDIRVNSIQSSTDSLRESLANNPDNERLRIDTLDALEKVAEETNAFYSEIHQIRTRLEGLIKLAKSSVETTPKPKVSLDEAIEEMIKLDAKKHQLKVKELTQGALERRAASEAQALSDKIDRETLLNEWKRDTKAKALLRVFTEKVIHRRDNTEQFEKVAASLGYLQTLGCFENSNNGIVMIPWYGRKVGLDSNPYADYRPIGPSHKATEYFSDAQIEYVKEVQSALIKYGHLLVEEGLLRE